MKTWIQAFDQIDLQIVPKKVQLRSSISDKRIARIIFTIIDHYMVLLNGFVKKTQQTPKEEIDLALKRMKEIQ